MSDIDKFEKPTHPGSGPQVPQDPTAPVVHAVFECRSAVH